MAHRADRPGAGRGASAPWSPGRRLGRPNRAALQASTALPNPYPPLVEVVKNQPTFELRDVAGSLVGFRFPDYAQGLNVSGYHFHFITADRSAGGHVLGCTLTRGELRVDREADLRLELPSGVGLPTPDQSDTKGETLDRIERE